MANPPKPTPKTETESQPNKWHIWIPIILVLVGWAYLHFSDYFELRVDKRVDLKLQESINKIDIKVQTTNDKLEKLGKDVAAVEAQLNLLIKVMMQPKTAVNAKQTSEILNTAKKSGTKFDQKLITTYGQEFISAGVSSSDPDIWKTALAFLDYRSTANTVGAATTNEFTPADKQKRYEWQGVFPVNSKNANFLFAHGKAVSADKAAVFEPIEKRLNIGKTVGSEFILLGGSTGFPGGWKLDGYRMKNVIFKDTEITYEGGPVDMQNVYFVNCTFNVAKKPNGKNFASTVLASAPATTFHAGG